MQLNVWVFHAKKIWLHLISVVLRQVTRTSRNLILSLASNGNNGYEERGVFIDILKAFEEV